MNKYRVTGQVFLADGFEWEIEADDERSAVTAAHNRGHDERWPEADVQEVIVNSTELIEEEDKVELTRRKIVMPLTPDEASILRNLLDLTAHDYKAAGHPVDAQYQSLVEKFEKAKRIIENNDG